MSAQFPDNNEQSSLMQISFIMFNVQVEQQPGNRHRDQGREEKTQQPERGPNEGLFHNVSS